MPLLPRMKASPGLLVRALVSLGAAAAIVAAVAAYVASGFDAALGIELLILVAIGALTRRYGIALPGNGFSSYILAVMVYAVLDRGWTAAVLVALGATAVGDVLLRRLPAGTALSNAAHLTAGTAAA